MRRAEDSAAEMGDPADLVDAERLQLAFTEQTAKSLLHSEAFPPAMHRGEHGSANDGVQPRGVAAAGGERNPHRAPAEPIAWRINRTTDRKSTRLNSSHLVISYAVFCLKKKKSM